ncbi:MAG: shikimate dehydrogenase [Nocardioidaceae bacterium]
MSRCAVLGTPIRHSLSPVLHRAAYAELGLDWTYESHEMAESDLPAFLDGLDETWRGLSLTMPLKRSVVPLLDELRDRADQARAANTVVLSDGRRTGHNTDVPGASAALRERWEGPVERAVILGGGATAASTLLGLADLGCREVTLLVRDEGLAAATLATAARHPHPPSVAVRRLGSTPPPADVLVSTVPATAQGAGVTDLVEGVEVVFDVVYDPWPTPLAVAAGEAGKVLVAGLDLLVHQAVLQVRLMTGRGADSLLGVMRRAGEHALEGRSA